MTSRRCWRGAAVIMMGIALLATLHAQEKPEEKSAAQPPPHAVKMLRVDPRDAAQISGLLGAFGVGVNVSEQMGLIAISGPPDVVARAEEGFRLLQSERAATRATPVNDNVEMIVHLLAVGGADSSSIPEGPLREVVAELKRTFPFSGFKLLETFVLRNRVGQEAHVTGLIPSDKAGMFTNYNFSCRTDGIQGEGKAAQIGFREFSLRLRVPVPILNNPDNFNYSDVSLYTSLQVPDGKTVVVGKAGAPGDSQGYLVVLTAKVVR